MREKTIKQPIQLNVKHGPAMISRTPCNANILKSAAKTVSYSNLKFNLTCSAKDEFWKVATELHERSNETVQAANSHSSATRNWRLPSHIFGCTGLRLTNKSPGGYFPPIFPAFLISRIIPAFPKYDFFRFWRLFYEIATIDKLRFDCLFIIRP
jgi:hypothetical protein